MSRMKVLLITVFLLSLSVIAQKRNEKIIEFNGDLEKGKTYSAEIEFDEKYNEWKTVKTLKLPFHHAGRIEWTNLKTFKLLPNSKRKIVFKIISESIYQADRNRWNTIYRAKILYLISEK